MASPSIPPFIVLATALPHLRNTIAHSIPKQKSTYFSTKLTITTECSQHRSTHQLKNGPRGVKVVWFIVCVRGQLNSSSLPSKTPCSSLNAWTKTILTFPCPFIPWFSMARCSPDHSSRTLFGGRACTENRKVTALFVNWIVTLAGLRSRLP